MNCPYCQKTTDPSYNYCINCEQQVKCKNCGEILVPNKSKCLNCGVALIVDNPIALMNEFTLEETYSNKSSSRSVRGKLSDTAIAQVAAMISSQTRQFVPQINRKKTSPGQFALPFDTQQPEPIDTVTDTESDSRFEPSNIKADTSLSRFFVKDGEADLVAQTKDFKGKNKKEQQIRFMLMFVGAYKELYHKPVPNQQSIFNALANSNMLDINAKAIHFQTVKKYLTSLDQGLVLNFEGEKEIKNIIADMQDDTKIGFTNWDKPAKARGKQSRLSAETEKTLKEWIDRALPSNFENFDIRSLKKPIHYAMLSIYLLTKEFKVAEAVQPALIYKYLKGKFATISSPEASIKRTLTKPESGSFLLKNGDGNYYLTPKGEEEVKKWVIRTETMDSKNGTE